MWLKSQRQKVVKTKNEVEKRVKGKRKKDKRNKRHKKQKEADPSLSHRLLQQSVLPPSKTLNKRQNVLSDLKIEGWGKPRDLPQTPNWNDPRSLASIPNFVSCQKTMNVHQHQLNSKKSSSNSHHDPKKTTLTRVFSSRIKMFTRRNLRIRWDRRRHCGGYPGSWQGSACRSGASTSWWWGSSSCPGRGGGPGSRLGSCPRRGQPRSGGSRRLASTCTEGLGSGLERRGVILLYLLSFLEEVLRCSANFIYSRYCMRLDAGILQTTGTTYQQRQLRYFKALSPDCCNLHQIELFLWVITQIRAHRHDTHIFRLIVTHTPRGYH